MTILHEDEQILVIRKPAGVLAQPDHTGDADVLTRGKQYLADGYEEDPFLGLVHRLDRPTSGVMVLAQTSAAARILSKQFRERTAQKQYLALVEGELRGIGTWRDYIAKPNRQPKIVSPDHPEGKRAELDWQAVGSGEGRTLLQIQLHTGRPHQVRLQAAQRDHPVVGDGRYGADQDWADEGIGLHHAILRVEHPATAWVETYIADVPERWASELSRSMRSAIDRMFSQARPAP